MRAATKHITRCMLWQMTHANPSCLSKNKFWRFGYVHRRYDIYIYIYRCFEVARAVLCAEMMQYTAPRPLPRDNTEKSSFETLMILCEFNDIAMEFSLKLVGNTG